MIYIGIIQFNNNTDETDKLKKVLQPLISNSPSIVKKNALTFCYGKLSNVHDLDEIWENSSSILIGRVFNTIEKNSFKKEDFEILCNLSKKKILEQIWGKYIYICENKEKQQWEVLIDITGQLPFFYYIFSNGNILFASTIEIIYKFLFRRPEYNWQYLCSYVIYGNSSSVATPFQDIYELPPACSLLITENEQKTFPFWSPYPSKSFQTQDVVTTLQSTLKSWIEPYQYIYISLSGGLDSSSLTYCLKEIITTQQTLKAINFYDSQIKSSNELFYARKICKDLDIELIEIDISESLIFDSHQKVFFLKPDKPFPGLIDLKVTEKIAEQLPLNNRYIFLSGQGSDHTFMSSPSKKLIFDYIINHGLKGVTKELNKIVQFYRESNLSILKVNFKEILPYILNIKKSKRKFNNPNVEYPVWIKSSLLEQITEDFSHPIYNYFSSKIPPGKYEQIDSFYESIASVHLELMNHANPTYYPFLYQPVVELALSFPTYQLLNKGYDRYPLRQGVNKKFRTDVVWRRDKSHITGSLQLGIKNNTKKIIELFLKGKFVEKRFIDMHELHKTIEQISNGSVKNLWPFIHLASAEMFLNYWEEKV